MRAAFVFTAALLASPAHAAEDLPPDGAAWGCASAAYFDRVETAAYDGPAHRSLYSSFYVDGPDSDIVEHVLTLPEGAYFADHAPRCWDFNADGAPDPATVVRSQEGKLALVAYVRGEALFEIGHSRDVTKLSPVAVRPLGPDAKVDIAYIRSDQQSADLIVTRIREGSERDRYVENGFADPTGIDHRVTDFVRDCGDGPELVLPSTNWNTLDVIGVTDAGLTRVTLAEKPDFSRLVRALECTSE